MIGSGVGTVDYQVKEQVQNKAETGLAQLQRGERQDMCRDRGLLYI